eukprot:TRINITY_DN7017_c0_g1_i1.p1 TRINITY_DN7017_c0_g1~~TRINITY_DN7017_c0_g1_i1.p1  ORF type:complete len:382 (+),score=65.62 TRINITY_DN7017_c0_g1_i1:1-1146(+)
MKVVLLIVLLIALVYGHGWINSPIPRGYQGNAEASASTSGPCGRTGSYGEVVTVTSGETLSVDFRNGGGHVGLDCSFSIGNDDTAASSFSQYPNVLTMSTCEAASTYTQDVPIMAPNGTWYLQWIWRAQGSTWYSCVQLNVLASGLTLVQVQPETVTPGSCTTDNLYYEVPLTDYDDDNIGLMIDLENKGSSEITFSVSTLLVPMDSTDGKLVSVPAGSKVSTAVTGGGKSAYVTVFGGCTGDYDLSVTPYEAYLDLANSQKVDASVSASSTAFYFSPSTTTSNRARRIVFYGSGASSCSASGPYQSSEDYVKGGDTRCIDLPLAGSAKDYGTNYYGLECTSDFEGSVELETGTCSAWEEPDSASMVGSMILFAFVVALLF